MFNAAAQEDTPYQALRGQGRRVDQQISPCFGAGETCRRNQAHYERCMGSRT
jgi:hypothetical protein